MKTFNEFINEGQHFLRSIGKNDKVVDNGIAFGDLRKGDWFFAYDDDGAYFAIKMKTDNIGENWYLGDIPLKDMYPMKTVSVDGDDGSITTLCSSFDVFNEETGLMDDECITVYETWDDVSMSFDDFKEKYKNEIF